MVARVSIVPKLMTEPRCGRSEIVGMSLDCGLVFGKIEEFFAKHEATLVNI